MDSDSLYFVGWLLTGLSYCGVFILGYSIRSYVLLHQRNYE